jgi:hypothetical protein
MNHDSEARQELVTDVLVARFARSIADDLSCLDRDEQDERLLWAGVAPLARWQEERFREILDRVFGGHQL